MCRLFDFYDIFKSMKLWKWLKGLVKGPAKPRLRHNGLWKEMQSFGSILAVFALEHLKVEH